MANYEAKRAKAQQKANETGKTTCIFETYEGYRIGFLTFKTVGSAQETFEPTRPTRTYSRHSHQFRNDDQHALITGLALMSGRAVSIIGEDVTLSRTYNYQAS